jgi:hypothetical protein
MRKLQLGVWIRLALLAVGWGGAQAAPSATNSAAINRILIIDPSTMPVAAGKATLTIGPLRRSDGVYSGDYKINVFPYFLRNDKGRLAIVVSDEALAKITQGNVAGIIGTATTSGPSGRSRHIDAIAMPVDSNHGTIKLWFTAGNRQMIFRPAYRFAGKETAGVVKLTETNFASNLQRSLPVSQHEAVDAASGP